MSQDVIAELMELSYTLLHAVETQDWETYAALCDPAITCFEPEARGHLVEGMDFHRYYFELDNPGGSLNSTIAAPHVRLLGQDAAVVSYVRLVQRTSPVGETSSDRFEETRIWQRRDGRWIHVHLHRSSNV